MAEKKNQQGPSLIDPIYQKFTRSVLRSLGSEEFYQFFMDSISRADNEIQFSNRKEVKTIDPTWVEEIEAAIESFQNIVSMPRIKIREDELIVNVAHAKKGGQDVVRHLASHAGLVEEYDDNSGDVKPKKVMQKYREETLDLYENRLVFTTLEMAAHFVRIRYDALFQAMSDEFGAKLKLRSDMDSATEHVHLDMFLHIKNTEPIIETDKKNREIFDRISRLHRLLGVFMTTEFAKQMDHFDRVKGPIHKTNILKRNPDYRAAVKLLEFLRSYNQIGYVIQIVEQNPVVDEQFQRDIFHNILFNYIVLKGHLEDEKDREVPQARKTRQRKLKPRFIKEIIEELVEDYDLPDVEVRKVLIEELTKEQLMQEEAAERLRLVEEQEQRKREEEERKQAEKEAEEERKRKEREAEAERKRLEREAEQRRRDAEIMIRNIEDRRRGSIFKKELSLFRDTKDDQIAARAALAEKQAEDAKTESYADAVKLLEEAERRKKEEDARERLRRKEERERLRREEEERQRAEEMARTAEEQRQLQQQIEQDLITLAPYTQELAAFREGLGVQKRSRFRQAEAARRAAEERERRRQERLARRAALSGK